MSGDVQPRKRKDKKKRKDELGVEEPRGTAAALGEGDVFMHSYHEHGTGGHWCAKIIFFSLLAVLITLIGLIILENRGLSELEANAVESRYSAILEGWLEDAPDDDHHDEHTLELKHHDDEDDHDPYHGQDDHDDEDEHGDDDEHSEEEPEDDEQNEESQEQDLEQADDEEEEGFSYSKFFGGGDDEDTAEDDEEDEQNDDDDEQSDEQDDENYSNEYYENLSNEIDENENLSNEVDDNDEEHNVDNDNEDEQNEIEDGQYDDEDEQSDDEDEQNDDKDEQSDDEDEQNEIEVGQNNDEDEQKDDEDEQNDDEDDQNDNEDEQDDDNDDEDEQNADNDGQSNEDDDEFEQNEDSLENEDEDEHDEKDDDEDEELEVEKIEQEPSDEEPISVQLSALPEEDDDDDQKDDNEDSNEDDTPEDEADDPDDADDDDFLDADEPLPVVERISAPAGKPFIEMEEDEASSERPPDTLEEEEEYEKQQEERRKEEEKSSHMWLKLTIGGALLVATHAVVRRATARDAPEREESPTRRETPVIDRRMTLIPEEPEPVVPRRVPQQKSKKPIVEVKNVAPVIKSAPKKQPSEEKEHEEPEEIEEEIEEIEEPNKEDNEKELYSDEDVEDEEEIVKEKDTPKTSAVETKAQETKVHQNAENENVDDVEDIDDEEIPDDVEIIDDEQIEEELEEEEEISDVDDTELLTRLEAKYGRLPEPDRPGQKHKDGGNSIEDDWPGEPADSYWRQQLDSAERELRQGEWSTAVDRASATELASSARARYIVATAFDRMAEVQRDNRLLSRAITAYLHLLKMNENLSDKKIKEITDRTLDRIQFRGNYLNAEPVYRLLIRRFPDEPGYRNNLTISFLMANRADLAEENLKETLRLWPKDRIALAHYAFVLKNQHNKYEEAVKLFEKALEGDKGPACEPRFYYHYGDALLLLGRNKEAHEVHKRGAKQGHFLSPAQRSLYNVKRLRGRPWWNIEETPYLKLARALEKSWKEILKEGEAARALYEQEREGLKERGDWSQLDLFVRGREIPDRCKRAPVTCSIVKSEPAAIGCRRGQIKFSAMEPGTHVRPHVGPTNCRLRMHLGLSNTKDTYLRVDQETRQWQEGKVLLFDDSFEHEVWHNGTAKRLVLIVDLWHPDLTPTERRSLPAI